MTIESVEDCLDRPSRQSLSSKDFGTDGGLVATFDGMSVQKAAPPEGGESGMDDATLEAATHVAHGVGGFTSVGSIDDATGDADELIPLARLAVLEGHVAQNQATIAALKTGMMQMASLFFVISETCAATIDTPTAAALHVVAAQAGELIDQFA